MTKYVASCPMCTCPIVRDTDGGRVRCSNEQCGFTDRRMGTSVVDSIHDRRGSRGVASDNNPWRFAR